MSENYQNDQQSRTPDYIVYNIREGRETSHWTRAGAAWNHKDGKGVNIVLDVLPLDGRLSLREYEADAKLDAA